MKPEIIFVSEKDGMVTMKKEELEALVDKAYQAGLRDGGGITTTPWIVSTTPTRPITPYYTTGCDKVTCGDGVWRTKDE